MGRMEMMKPLFVLLPGIIVSALFGQLQSDLLEKAPPHVDKALRERISIFYQAHVDAKFRLADTVVHEDSKDAFFVAQKDQHKGFEIIKINYSDHFTRARAVVAVDTDFVMPGFGKQLVKIPLTTLWKYADGDWWWCVRPKQEGLETPFGIMKPGPDPEKAAVYDRLANMPSAGAIRGQVQVSKTEVRLSSYEPATDEVIITNGMPGPITLSFTTGSFLGYEAKLDRTELNSGEKAKILFRCDPVDKSAKPTVQAKLRIFPTNRVIPIRITFAIPPEIEKQLPKM